MSYEEHIQYYCNQKTRAMPGNLRLLDSIDLRSTFTSSLAFIVLIFRYLEGDCCGLFVGTMSVCV